MEYKPYDSGLVVGRFQTFHIGHAKLVETALMLCDRVYVLVGSAQESGTERNPLNVSTRMDIIKAIYGDKVSVYALPDMSSENDICVEWGRFLLDKVDLFLNKVPEVMIYGNDESRSKWFATSDIPYMTEVIINRFCADEKDNISASRLRKLMVEDKRKEWMSLVPIKEHKLYDRIRAELMAVPYYNNLIK